MPPDLGDAAIADSHRRDNAAFIVQRQKLTIDKRKVLRTVTRRRPFPNRTRCISQDRYVRSSCRTRREAAKYGPAGSNCRTLDEITARKTGSFLIVICHFRFLLWGFPCSCFKMHSGIGYVEYEVIR
jgi:hypothetical protein